MVGAGELYFKRSDDPNGFHHLGNVEEFTITNDVTTVEKNSSMNKKRELMASVTTAIEPSASITMNEYNPYNMALGLYGIENVHTQAAKVISSEPYTVESVPGIITLVDADGARYFNVSNVVVGPPSASPASVAWDQIGGITGATTTATISTTTDTDDTITDDDGTKIIVSPGTYGGTSTESVYVMVTQANSVAGAVAGVKVKVQVGPAGTAEELTFDDTTSATQTKTTQDPANQGLSITVTVDSTNLVTPNPAPTTTPFMNWGRFIYTPAVSTLTEGVDYVLDDQRLRGGVITIPATSTLQEGDTVYVSANVPEASYPTVSGAAAGDIAGELLFLGDPNIGGNYVIEAWKVKVTPDGDFTGLISDDFGSFQLSIKFLADYEHHAKYPFYKATMIGKGSGTSSNAGKYDPKY